MDQILIKNLTVFANHGVLEAENVLGQKFVLSAVLELDVHQAAQDDDLTKSIDYGSVCYEIQRFLSQHTFRLLETCAEKLITHLLLLYPPIQSIDLTLEKPWAPIKLPIDSVGVRLKRARHIAYIALGSNMGDKEAHLQRALQLLDQESACKVLDVSTFIVTKPYGNTMQDDFLNGVCKIETLLSPQDLLDCLHKIETVCGRVRTEHWGPRTLDLDIIFYDDIILQAKNLTIPHIDMHNRRFVLEPLNQIAPYYLHPVYEKRVCELLKLLPNG